MKQTFNIPEGCKEVTIEQVGNQVITTFEPERYIPKKGDFIKFGDGFAECLSNPTEIQSKSFDIDFGHWKPSNNEMIINEFENITCWDYNTHFEKITPEQFQEEFNKLGYGYDFDMHTASRYDT